VTTRFWLGALALLGQMLPLTGLAQAVGGGNAANGKLIVETRCVACHALDANRVGPALGTVFGRQAGTAPDFSYSKALAAAKHRWDRDKLLAWLADPEALVPGQGMGYRVEQASDRADVVAYLTSLKPGTRP
jgi:cytochrome c